MKLLIMIIWMPFLALAQSDKDILDRYIGLGLKNNLALQQKNYSYMQSIEALREARGMFLPSLSIEARYSRAGGGREIEFPVGDLLNPVYSTLNQLLQQNAFPTLQNETIPFLRGKEQETKLRFVQPVFQKALFSNYSLKSNLNQSSEAELASYKSLLISEIKTSYYKYLQSIQLVRLFENTLAILDENVRVSNVLFENNMVTKDVVYRSNSEKLKIEQQLAQAKQQNILAQSYFNFLLNRDMDEQIISSVPAVDDSMDNFDLPEAEALAVKNRYEIKQMLYAYKASQNATSLAGSAYYPNVNLVVDYGFQGEKYNFGKDDDYWMASVVLSWNLFNGFKDDAKKQQAQYYEKSVNTRLQELKNQVRLQVREAWHGMKVAKKNLASARQQEEQAGESFKIISQKYEEGMSPQIEYIDARVNMTNASINQIISLYNYKIKQVELDNLINASKNENNIL